MKIRYSEIKDRIDIDQVEAALGFEPVTHDKGNDIGHCLFPHNHSHGDTTGKFAIHRDKLIYNCWVCGGGSLLSLVMELHDLDVDAATLWLHQYATGVDNRSDQEFTQYLLEVLEDVEERHETLPYFNERVLDRFGKSYAYFEDRGIDEAVVDAYNLRYSNTVMKSAPMKKRGEMVEKVGEDYIGPAAIFPHYWQDRLVGWQHRWIDWDEDDGETPVWLAKYTNTTDFPKDSTLFNYDGALQSKEPVVVVESIITCLFLISCGYPAVSYFGGGIKPAQLRLLRRFQQGVILSPDNDDVGDKFVRAATEYLERFISVFHAEKVQLGPKADLGDYAKTSEPQANLDNHLKWLVHRAGVEL